MKRLVFIGVIGAAVALGGCGKQSSDAGDPNELQFYCGAGLRPPAAEIVDAFYKARGVRVACDYAGSETLLSKIKLARRGDLYMPGDEYYMHQILGGVLLGSHDFGAKGQSQGDCESRRFAQGRSEGGIGRS